MHEQQQEHRRVQICEIRSFRWVSVRDLTEMAPPVGNRLPLERVPGWMQSSVREEPVWAVCEARAV
eukprot:4569833-Prymnesium_polylepis.1